MHAAVWTLLALPAATGTAVLIARTVVPKPLLLSIPYSHFVELARWALHAGGHRAWELKVGVGPHLFVAPVVRLLFKGGMSSTSSFPGSTEHSRPPPSPWTRRVSGVPAVVTSAGDCLPDSWAVLRYCGFSVDADVQELLDTVVGPAVRQIACARSPLARLRAQIDTACCGQTTTSTRFRVSTAASSPVGPWA